MKTNDTEQASMHEAIEMTRLAYQFDPGSYTYAAYQTCLAAREMMVGESERWGCPTT
jgi:hypothetical protein